jgi:hypothetical protein
MHVRFHAIQRSDRKIDDRFNQNLMTNQSNNLQKIVSINFKKNSRPRRVVKWRKNVEASVEPADLTSIVRRLKSTIGFSC